MANNKQVGLQVDLILNGGEDLQFIADAINELGRVTAKLPTKLPFEAALKSAAESAFVFEVAYNRNLDLVLDKTRAVTDLLLQKSKTPIDVDISGSLKNLDLLATKGKQTIDLLTGVSKTRININLDDELKLVNAAVAEAERRTNSYRGTLEKLQEASARTAQRVAEVRAQLERIGAKEIALKVNADNVAQFEKQLRGVATAADAGARGAERATAGAKALAAAQQQAGREAGQHRLQQEGLLNAMQGTAREALFLRRAIFGLGFAALGQEVLQAVTQFDKLRAQFKAVFQEKADAELEFIRREADRLGASILNLGDQYAKFQTAVKGTALEGQKAKDVFLATAEAASRLALSQEDFNGALVALQQIASKGRLSLEELRQQLGDRLPGAVRIAAESLGITQARLFKLIETGQIDSNTFLAGFGDALRKNFNTDASTRIETVAAAIQRVRNAFSELLDRVTQGEGVAAIRQATDALVEFANNPDTIAGIKSLISAIAGLTKFVIENASAIATLLKAYLAFKGITILVAFFNAATAAVVASTGAFGRLLGIVVGTSGAVTANTAAVTANTAATAANTAAQAGNAAARTGLAGAMTGAANAAGLLLTGLRGVTVALGALTIAYYAAEAAGEFFGKRAAKAIEEAIKVELAVKQIAASARRVQELEALGVTLDDLSDKFIKSAKAIGSLTANELQDYVDRVQEAVAANKLQAELIDEQIKLNKAQQDAIRGNADATREQKDQLIILNSQLKDLEERQKAIRAQTIQFKSAMEVAREAIKGLGQDLDKLDPSQLTEAQKAIVDGFDKLIESGKTVREALDKAIPPEFAQGSAKAIEDVIRALKALEKQGKITGDQLRESIAKELNKLNGDELLKFQTQLETAFKNGKIGAQGFADALKGAARAALQGLGVDADLAGTKISKSFNDAIKLFNALGQNAQVTGKQLKEAFDKLIINAQTKEELELLRKQLEAARAAGAKIGPEFEDSMKRLEDKLRSVRSVLDSALGDSFRRLGIQTKAVLNDIAEQAEIDFNRVKESGLANLDQLKAGFANFAKAALAASGGVLTIPVKLGAFQLDAFDVLVQATQTASEKVKAAFDTALNSANGKAQLAILREAITNTFNSGRISAEEYATAIDQLNTKTYELALATTDGLGGALQRLGVQTKEQLGLVADQLKADFEKLVQAGVLTADQLQQAFNRYAEAAIKSNDDVAATFERLRSEAESLGLNMDALANKASNAATKVQAAANGGSGNGLSGPYSIGNLGEMSLEKFNELIRSLRNSMLGQAPNSEQYLADLARQYEAARIQYLKQNQPTNLGNGLTPGNGQQNAGGTSGGAGGAGAVNRPGSAGSVAVTFNFNNTNLTPQGVRDAVVPTLDRLTRRGV